MEIGNVNAQLQVDYRLSTFKLSPPNLSKRSISGEKKTHGSI
jgi:hypothetical protein